MINIKCVYNPLAQLFTILLLTEDVGPYGFVIKCRACAERIWVQIPTRLGTGAYGMRPYEVVIEFRACVEGIWVQIPTRHETGAYGMRPYGFVKDFSCLRRGHVGAAPPTVGATIGRPRKIFIEFIEFIEFI